MGNIISSLNITVETTLMLAAQKAMFHQAGAVRQLALINIIH